MTSRLTEKLSGARLIKAFRLEDYAIERLNRNFEQIFQLRMKAVRARGRMGPALEALAGVGDRRRRRLRLLAHRQRHQHGRRLHGLHHRAAAGGAADQVARHRDDRDARGPGRRRAHLRAARREADHGRPARTRGRSPSTPGAIVFDNVGFAYATAAGQPAVQATSRSPCRAARPWRWSAARAPASRPSSIWWRGCSTSTAGRILIDGQDVRDVTLASLRRRDRHRQPGDDAVRRHDPRQHRARPARRQRGGDRRRRQGRRRRTSSSWRSRRATTP